MDIRDYDSRWVPSNPNLQQRATFFVKVYMEGIPIGRKLDLFAQRGYEDLVKTLRGLFTTIIKCEKIFLSLGLSVCIAIFIWYGRIHASTNFSVRLHCLVIHKGLDPDQLSVKKTHVLAYEDKEGDWMLVGDVPWE